MGQVPAECLEKKFRREQSLEMILAAPMGLFGRSEPVCYSSIVISASVIFSYETGSW